MYTGYRLRPAHSTAGRGKNIRLRVVCTYPQLDCFIQAHTHEPLGLIRFQVAALLGLKVNYTQLWFNDDIIRMERDHWRLAQLNICDDVKLEAKQVFEGHCLSFHKQSATGTCPGVTCCSAFDLFGLSLLLFTFRLTPPTTISKPA